MAYQRKVRRKLLRKTSNQVLKISTYQLSQSVKVIIMDKHLVFGHRLEGLLIHVDGERDGILLCVSHHKYSKIIGTKVTHMCNWRLCLVEGAPTVDDLRSTLLIRGNHARWGMDPLLQWNIRAHQHSFKQPFPARLSVFRPGREHRSSGYPLWGLLSNFGDI